MRLIITSSLIKVTYYSDLWIQKKKKKIKIKCLHKNRARRYSIESNK